MKEPVLPPPKKPSLFATIGAGIVGLVIFAAIFMGFYRNEPIPSQPVVTTAEPLEVPPAPDWVDETGINLPPVGSLPSLQQAMRTNPDLRRRVEQFGKKTEGVLFARYRETDADITAILLLWAGANLSDSAKTREGIDGRVDTFIRRVYMLGGLEPITNHHRLGGNPWPRLFAYYKVRLMAQTKGGQGPFAGTLVYSIGNDRITLENGRLNRRFFSDYGAFLRTQPDAAQLRANLLAYVKAVDSSLLETDAQTAALLR